MVVTSPFGRSMFWVSCAVQSRQKAEMDEADFLEMTLHYFVGAHSGQLRSAHRWVRGRMSECNLF